MRTSLSAFGGLRGTRPLDVYGEEVRFAPSPVRHRRLGVECDVPAAPPAVPPLEALQGGAVGGVGLEAEGAGRRSRQGVENKHRYKFIDNNGGKTKAFAYTQVSLVCMERATF